MTKQKTILITGVSRGLGISAFEAALRLGCRVVGLSRSDPDARLQKALADFPDSAVYLKGDVCDPLLQDRAVKMAVDTFGGIDALLHNAAVLEPLAPTGEASDSEYKRAFDVNFFSAIQLTKAALPALRKSSQAGDSARIVFVSSGAAEHAYYSWGAYCTSKAALHMFCKTLAKEEPSIVSVSVKPGVCDTAMQVRSTGAKSMRAEDHSNFVGRHERGELNDPDEVGYVLTKLAMECPAKLTGEIFNWNESYLGGYQLKK